MTLDYIKATTSHQRRGAIRNGFSYAIDFVLSEPEALPSLPRLFSVNQRNVFSYFDRDHGGARGAGRGAAWVREVLADHGIADRDALRILLLAQPRVFNTRFKPVSFWMVVDTQDQLIACIAEVNNTFGDRHCYICFHDDHRPIEPTDTMAARKLFHVSPFQPIAGTYRFNFALTADQVDIRIDLRHGQGGLLATLNGTRRPLTSAAIVQAVCRRPFGSLRVMALIHYQALKLWFKRAPFKSRPTPPERAVSR